MTGVTAFELRVKNMFQVKIFVPGRSPELADVGCDAVVYVVVSVRISAHVVCMYGAVEVYAWRVHHVHGLACDRVRS